jgi:hypothetical protein
MARKSVLAIGIDPAFADFTTLSGLTPELVRSYIDAQIEQVRALGYDVESCLIDLGDTAEAMAAAALSSKPFDCVVIGAGLRQPQSQLLLFEKLINLVHALAPNAKFASTAILPTRRKPCSAGSSSDTVGIFDAKALAAGGQRA